HFVHGDHPTWPVIAFKNVYILPGVPEIFRRKFKSIREKFRGEPYHLKCVFTRDEEGTIAAHLDAIVAAHPAVQVGSYPKLDGSDYKVKVTIESKDRAAVDAATNELVAALGPSVLRVV